MLPAISQMAPRMLGERAANLSLILAGMAQCAP
jgi:hypothetical protein